MPELPEVETIRQDLLQKILNKKIIDAQILNKKTVHNKENYFLGILKNNKVKNIDRVGKLLIFELEGGKFLLTHLKMTGQLIYVKNQEITAGGHSEVNMELTWRQNVAGKHTRVIIRFTDNATLFFNDLRMFGYMKIVNEKEKEKIKLKFGIEPLTENFTLDNFKRIFKSRKTFLKVILLNQKLIAGLGNIYVDEACHLAGIRPIKSVKNMTEIEIKKLHQAIKKVIKKAIDNRGTTFNNYMDANGNKGNFVKYLKVYGRGGQDCKKCHNKLKKMKLGGRGTVYCDICQK